MQRKKENNSRWYHRDVLVGILILWRNSKLQLCALFCGFLLGGGNVDDPPPLLSPHQAISQFTLTFPSRICLPLFIQRVVEISPPSKKAFWFVWRRYLLTGTKTLFKVVLSKKGYGG